MLVVATGNFYLYYGMFLDYFNLSQKEITNFFGMLKLVMDITAFCG
jgi:hypothetical protein